jgi:hypothetical protein
MSDSDIDYPRQSLYRVASGTFTATVGEDGDVTAVDGDGVPIELGPVEVVPTDYTPSPELVALMASCDALWNGLDRALDATADWIGVLEKWAAGMTKGKWRRARRRARAADRRAVMRGHRAACRQGPKAGRMAWTWLKGWAR